MLFPQLLAFGVREMYPVNIIIRHIDRYLCFVSFQITGILNMLVRATADVETNIVSVERCLEYTRTPTEVILYLISLFICILP